MKQAVVTEPGKIVYQEVAGPALEPDNVIIRIARIGICGSDIHVFKGKHPLVRFPLVQGHEFSGYIEQAGSRVEGLQPGDLVTVEPAIGCGECPKCRAGRVAQCERMLFVGGALPGAGSELLAMNSQYVLRMPPGVAADDAAMTEPLAVAVHAVRRASSVEGKNVLVLGAGTIGNLTAQVARLFGAASVVLVDKLPFRNSLAKQLGFPALDPGQVDSLDDAIRRLFGGESPQVAFECAGGAAPLNTCIRTVVRGGDVVVVGVYEEDPRTEMILVQDRELNLLGALMYTWDDFHTAVDLIAKRQVELNLLRTHHFPFDRWPDAYKLLLENPNMTMKVMIDLA